MLMPHVTRLAKSDEIISDIGRLCAVKEPERFDVVDWKALPDMDATVGAVPALILHDSRAGSEPTSTAIGSRSTNPIRRILRSKTAQCHSDAPAKAFD